MNGCTRERTISLLTLRGIKTFLMSSLTWRSCLSETSFAMMSMSMTATFCFFTCGGAEGDGCKRDDVDVRGSEILFLLISLKTDETA